jgi:hypothetical protein
MRIYRSKFNLQTRLDVLSDGFETHCVNNTILPNGQYYLHANR